MTDSNFDPKNPNAGGVKGGLDRYLSPPARDVAKMPADEVDGKVDVDAPEDNELSHEALPPEEAARKLEEMRSGRQPGGE
jgi:hypothetical protein